MSTRMSIDPTIFTDEPMLFLPEYVILRGGPVTDYAVLVHNGKFTDVGPATELQFRYADTKKIALPGACLMPGFIDAHHHLTQAFGKALAFGEPSEIFKRIWVPLEGSLTEDLVYLAGKLAALESLRGGFTTVVDAGTRAEGDLAPLAQAVTDAGLRCVLGLICNDKGGGAPTLQSHQILQRAEKHLANWQSKSLIHPSLAISIPEAASNDMLYSVASLCHEAGVVFQTHVNEHLSSVERSIIDKGLRPLEHLHSVEALGPQTLIAHATLLTPHELRLIKETDTAIAYNPVATLWKGNATAPATSMHELGIRFGIGTDSTRSDGFRLLDAAEAAQRLAFGIPTGDFSTGGGWPWFDHATSGGAEAISLENITGEIAAGKAADFLIIDINIPEFHPSRDLIWELTRFGNRDQIMGVFVAGELRLWNGWPLDWDARSLMREVSKLVNDAIEQAPIKKLHPTSTEHRKLFQSYRKT
ncbi:amidohydrolase family protein [Alkalihalobacillus sp. MEB130]|uniref:amidohydrolase family protein n=1 Tax=Alkalihalobacillus sp. MEB130 TaxID=2976704 RepID=UPI0028DE7A39|nr:amidohydrolase family protein [Alkalihalobacillus sp. MEB130]MDT8860763.1 amidohydrolase family protein [Alkalihalobacillus sp. MEB130]